MPSLGSDMEAGTLVEQVVSPGDTLQSGDVIGAVETQKGVIEIEVFEDGTFDHWVAKIGQTVPVGAPLAVIRGAGEDALSDPKEPTPTKPQPAPPETVPIPPETEPYVPTEPTAPPEIVPLPPEIEPIQPEPADPEITPRPSEVPEPSEPRPTAPPEECPPPSPVEPDVPPEIEPYEEGLSSQTRRRITPAARRLAAARGIDVTTLASDLKEPITRRDIETIELPKPRTVSTDFRTAIAAAMARSKREIPHYYLSHDIDLTLAEQHLIAENAEREPADRLLLGALCAKAVASTISKFPEFNGHYTDGRFQPSEAVHLGFAINIRSGGLVAPALFDAGDQSLNDLMRNLRDLTARVRTGRFRARELSDATITLTSLGDRGTDAVFGVIYPPQVAIVGMGAARTHPAVVDGELVARKMATFTLAADHRVSDGHRGALFLRAIDKHLQSPEDL